MEKNMNNIDNLFKEELGGYTEAPPPMVWDALEKRLQDDNKRRVYPYRWLWYVSIVSFIVLLGSSIAWMMANNAGNKGLFASAVNTEKELPKTTAVAAVNGPGSKTGENSNAEIITHSKKGHHTANNTANQTIKSSSRQQEPAVARKARAEKHHGKHNAATVSKKETKEDLYADTDDDQYTIGGTSNTHRNYETPDHDGPAATYATQTRSQHNILVAETDPGQTVQENNYGSHTAVAASRAKELADAHYDIALSDDNSAADDNYKAHTSHRAPAQKHKFSNTGVANNNNPHAVTPKDAIASLKKKPDHKGAGKPAVTNSIAVPPAIAATHRPARKRINATGNEPKEAAVIVPKQQPNNKPTEQVTASLQPVIKKAAGIAATTHKTQTDAVPEKKTQSNNVIASGKAVAKKTTPAPVVVSAPAASAMIAATTKTETHKAAHTAKSSKAQKEAAVSVTPVVAATTPATLKTAAAENAKTDNPAVKPVTNQYGAGTKSVVKTARKPVVKSEAPVAAVKQNNATKDQKVAKSNIATTAGIQPITGSNNAGQKKETIVKKQKPAEKIAGNTIVKKTQGNGAQPDRKVMPGKAANGQDKTETVNDKPLAKNDRKAAKKEAPGKVAKQDKAEAVTDKPVARNEVKPSKKETARKASSNKSTPPPAATPANIYSSSFSNRTLEQETVMVDNLKVNNFAAQQPLADASNSSDAYYDLVPGTFKNDDGAGKTEYAAQGSANNTTNDSVAKHSLFARKFEYGVKGGMESGFNARGGNKLVVAPYLQYDLSNKLSLLTQPSIKVSHVNSESVGGTQTYSDNSKGKFTATDSGAVYIIAYTGSSSVSIEETLRKYNYTYDSIVKSYSAGGAYVEVELPLLLQYKIGKRLSVYAGANSVFSKYTSIKENTNDYTGTFRTVTFLPANSPVRLPDPASLALPGKPISQYAGPLYPAQKGDLFRMGYMLGFSYEYKKRWLFDALVQQAMVKPNYEAGVNTNAPLSMPYFRLTLGYKLTK